MPVSRAIEKAWHARISDAVRDGALPDEKRLDVEEFKRWAYTTQINKLDCADSIVTVAQSRIDTPVPGLTATLGDAWVNTPLPACATDTALRVEIARLQKELNDAQKIIAAQDEELQRLRARKKIAIDSGKQGGRGNAK